MTEKMIKYSLILLSKYRPPSHRDKREFIGLQISRVEGAKTIGLEALKLLGLIKIVNLNLT